MRTRVKICCIASRAEARAAVVAGADALGLVGAMPSGPGVIDLETAREIAGATPPPAARWLLTSATEAEAIARDVATAGVDTVQIVPHIAPAEHARLAALLPAAVRRVQVVHVEGPEALDLIDVYAPHADAFLLDSGRPSLPTPEYGGTGRTHDWSVSAEFVRRAPKPVFLAGGLHAGNIADAIATVGPYGVDLCSGVRTDGAIDAVKLRDFFTAVREISA
ncbi:MAG: phosphoribosylanthranilate isomerase [Pseudomonadota bacterium]